MTHRRGTRAHAPTAWPIQEPRKRPHHGAQGTADPVGVGVPKPPKTRPVWVKGGPAVPARPVFFSYAGGALSDRRRYPRVQANVVCRPAGSELFHHRRSARDVSIGGMRIYSDDEFSPGDRLDLDVLLPDESLVRCWAQVVWIVKLSPPEPARFDVGLRFDDIAPSDVQKLAAVLGPGPPGS